jgi:hypothetical protein
MCSPLTSNFRCIIEALAARLVLWCIHEICMFTINICIYIQPPKDFTREDLKVVVVLMCAWGTTHA